MKIVVLDGYAANPGDLSWAPLEALGELNVFDRTPADQVAARIADAELVLTNKTVLTRELIAGAKGLKYIGVLSTGYNVVDVAAAAALQAVAMPSSTGPVRSELVAMSRAPFITSRTALEMTS